MARRETFDPRPTLHCARCSTEILDRLDDAARLRLAILVGRTPSLLWRHDAPWRYVDLCRPCARALDSFLRAGVVEPQPRDETGAKVPAGGGWIYPLEATGGCRQSGSG